MLPILIRTQSNSFRRTGAAAASPLRAGIPFIFRQRLLFCCILPACKKQHLESKSKLVMLILVSEESDREPKKRERERDCKNIIRSLLYLSAFRLHYFRPNLFAWHRY